MKKHIFNYDYFFEENGLGSSLERRIQEASALVDFENGGIIEFNDGYVCHDKKELRDRIREKGGRV